MFKIIKFLDKISIWTDDANQIFNIEYRYTKFVPLLPKEHLIELNCFESELWIAAQHNRYQFESKLKESFVPELTIAYLKQVHSRLQTVTSE
jgi:hypothetical protein